MTIPEALLVALLMWGAYAYYSMGSLMIIDPSASVPSWLRRALLPRSQAVGPLRIASLTWTIFVSVVSQGLVIAVLVTRSPGYSLAVHAILWLELLAAVGWTVMLVRLSHRGRSSVMLGRQPVEERFLAEYARILDDLGHAASDRKARRISAEDFVADLERLVSRMVKLEAPRGDCSQLKDETLLHVGAQLRRYQTTLAGIPASQEDLDKGEAELRHLLAAYERIRLRESHSIGNP